MREAVPLAFLYSIEYSDLAPHPPHPNPRARAVGHVGPWRETEFGLRRSECFAHAQFSTTTRETGHRRSGG